MDRSNSAIPAMVCLLVGTACVWTGATAYSVWRMSVAEASAMDNLAVVIEFMRLAAVSVTLFGGTGLILYAMKLTWNKVVDVFRNFKN